ncbi:hypothetical protein CSOJ01_04008 [Colletotrichum sojae]|uniref:Uncharacterized protein n=1 Tax=Colletotrichum sojae TaxID=2175907 RepID=A0A8H6MZ78_9PEZI|nr:hypothetical protein CSOJ01_04008 [Colletotrichum sojae]
MASNSPDAGELSDEELAKLPFRRIAERHFGGIDAFLRPLEWTAEHLKQSEDENNAMSLEDAEELGTLIAVCGFRPARMDAMREVLEHYSFTYQGRQLSLHFATMGKDVRLKPHCETFQSPRISGKRSFLLVHVDYFAIMQNRNASLTTIKRITEEEMLRDPYIAGLLIALAEKWRQEHIRRADSQGPHRVHLLLRHLHDNSRMRIYTATVTSKFLNRLKLSGHAPQGDPEETKLEISYVTLQYKPYKSLHRRLVQAIYKCNST